MSGEGLRPLACGRSRGRDDFDHSKGDPLYIIEVMKMFNKVYATFAGTVTGVLTEGGVVVRKGQPLFRSGPTRSSSRRIRPSGHAGFGRAPTRTWRGSCVRARLDGLSDPGVSNEAETRDDLPGADGIRGRR